MKRIIILVMLLVAHASLVIAQVNFGVKGGANLNNTSFKDLPKEAVDFTEGFVGVHVGVYSQIKIADKFSVIPELQFIKKGYSYKVNSDREGLRLSYIELPLVASYSPIKIISIEAGPAIGVMLSAKSTFKNSSLHEVYNEAFEFGLTGGLKINLAERISLGCRYYRGLTNISKVFFTEDGINGHLSKEFNSNLLLSGYYKLK